MTCYRTLYNSRSVKIMVPWACNATLPNWQIMSRFKLLTMVAVSWYEIAPVAASLLYVLRIC